MFSAKALLTASASSLLFIFVSAWTNLDTKVSFGRIGLHISKTAFLTSGFDLMFNNFFSEMFNFSPSLKHSSTLSCLPSLNNDDFLRTGIVPEGTKYDLLINKDVCRA